MEHLDLWHAGFEKSQDLQNPVFGLNSTQSRRTQICLLET
jgi:hypothetical protein